MKGTKTSSTRENERDRGDARERLSLSLSLARFLSLFERPALAIGSEPRTHNYTLAERARERRGRRGEEEEEEEEEEEAVRKEETSMATLVLNTSREADTRNFVV